MTFNIYIMDKANNVIGKSINGPVQVSNKEDISNLNINTPVQKIDKTSEIKDKFINSTPTEKPKVELGNINSPIQPKEKPILGNINTPLEPKQKLTDLGNVNSPKIQ